MRSCQILSSEKHTVTAVGILLLCLLPATAVSWDFRLADMEGLANVSLAYGLLARTQGRNKDLIGFANGGKVPSVNADDGDLNQDQGGGNPSRVSLV